MKTALCCFLVLFAALPAIRAQAMENSHFEFSGEVTRGQTYYTHSLPEGLIFFLIPTAEGWTIDVQKAHSGAGISSVTPNLADITPPIHGPNAIDIEGSNLGNNDFPGKDHAIMFALSDNDHKSVWFDYDCNIKAQSEDTCKNPYPIPKRLGYARLHITDYQLSGDRKLGSDPLNGDQPHYMKFTVSGDYEAPRKDFP